MAHLAGTVEQIIGRLASAAHGVVTRQQLLGAGISKEEIRHRLQTGSLIRIHPGVYRVGHWAPSFEADYLAAVLACGQGAFLSGRAAAYLWGLIKGRPPTPEVTAPTKRRLRGVITHRLRRCGSSEITMRNNIPVTKPPRTLVDLAAVLTVDDLARACHEAGVRYRVTPREVKRVLEQWPSVKGAKKLRLIMNGDEPVVLSKLEKRFLRLLKEQRLPRPVTNRPKGSFSVDCRWPEHRLTVELDSYRFHNSRHAWQQDRKREREAYARGDDFRRYTWGDVFEHPAQMLAELKQLLPRK